MSSLFCQVFTFACVHAHAHAHVLLVCGSNAFFVVVATVYVLRCSMRDGLLGLLGSYCYSCPMYQCFISISTHLSRSNSLSRSVIWNSVIDISIDRENNPDSAFFLLFFYFLFRVCLDVFFPCCSSTTTKWKMFVDGMWYFVGSFDECFFQ